jgi:ribosomal protein S18 acetylase RimI-like enzyme
MQIVLAHDADHIPTVRELFQEYAADMGLNFCFQGFSEELASLPGKYAPPDGRLLLGECDGQPVACVAMRKITDDTCEMKRLYVRSAFRGRGFGRALAEAVIRSARDVGYRAMKLDTLASMKTAVTLYESLGFRRTAAYYDNPLPDVVYFKLQPL